MRHQASKKLNLSYLSLLSRFDSLTISNNQNYKYGVYCGERTGHTVLVNGSYVVIRFSSDEFGQFKGFLLVFTSVQIRKYEARTPPQQRTTKLRPRTIFLNNTRAKRLRMPKVSIFKLCELHIKNTFF